MVKQVIASVLLSTVYGLSLAGVTVLDDEPSRASVPAPQQGKAAISPSPTFPLEAIIRPTAEQQSKWVAEKTETLKQALTRWSVEAGWEMEWKVVEGNDEIDYPLPTRYEFPGTFDKAARDFVSLYKRAEVPLHVDINILQKFIRVSAGEKVRD